MSIIELSPEESLAAANAISLAIYRAYSLNDAVVIADFVNAIEGCLTLLLSKKALIDINESSCKRQCIDDTDIAARLALLEDLLLTLQ